MLTSVLFGSLTLNTLVVSNPLPYSHSGPSNLVTPRQYDNSSCTSSPTDANSLSPITPDMNVPDGYSMGFSTQDCEPVGQQSICNTNCQLARPFSTTAGPLPLPPNVFAAAIPPSLGGGSDDCSPCGSCYSIVQSGTPYCQADPYDPSCGTPSGPNVQSGPKSIKILITNHCTDCDKVPGHFDINQAPAGWNNPRIYWKKLDDSECY